MTKDDLFFYTEAKQILEFEYDAKIYRLSYDKDSNGKDIISFGRLYEEEKFSSFKDLMVRAKIGNSFFREMLDVIKLV